MKRTIAFFPFILLAATLLGQIGGQHVYEFLNLTASARLVALGGVNVSIMDDDVHFGSQNPALVNPDMHRQAGLSFSNYLAGIRFGYAGYSQTVEGVGSFHSGIQYMNSGQMRGADEFGAFTQMFSAQELAWTVGASRSWGNFRYGANLKFISSSLAPGFGSTGLAMDMGGAYQGKEGLFSAGIVMRNMGTQLSTYTGTGSREPLPFELVAGVSNRLRYMPMRFSATLIQLEHPNLIFDDPDTPPEVDLNGNVIEPGPRIADRIARHFIFSTEFYLGSFLRLRAGYNHLRRQELRSVNRGGMTGFSLGVGIKTKRFGFDYGYSSYGVRNTFNVHQFSLILNLAKAEPAKSSQDAGINEQ